MSRCVKTLVSILLLMLWVSSLGLVVFADSDTSTGSLPPSTFSPVEVEASLSIPSDPTIDAICMKANESVGGIVILYTEGVSGGTTSGSVAMILKFKNQEYSKLSGEDKRTFMENALSATTKSGLGAKVKNKVYNFIASQDSAVSNALRYLQSDANADFVSAKKFFDPWSGVVGTIMGVLCVFVFMFSGFSIMFDMGYLILPGVRYLLERGEDTVKPFGVSREAYSAFKDAEKSDEYKNVLSIYMKRRIGLIFAMSICIGYLISGKVFDIVMTIIDAFQ